METSQQLQQSFQELKMKRKNGEINEAQYYKELLKLAKRLIESLEEEDISCEDAKAQIPLITLFVTEQIEKFAKRGH